MDAIVQPAPPSDEILRVLVAEATCMDGQLIAASLKRCRHKFDVQAVALDSARTLRELNSQKPDVAIISAELPDGRFAGFKVLHQLHSHGSSTATVMLLNTAERDLVVDSFRLGARGVFCRDSSFKTLAKCIVSVHGGHVWISNTQLEFLLDLLTKIEPTRLIKTDGMRVLTQREQQIVHLVAEGLRNKDIAAKLEISEHTVKNYIFRVFEKLGLSTRVELVIYALSEPEASSSQSGFSH